MPHRNPVPQPWLTMLLLAGCGVLGGASIGHCQQVAQEQAASVRSLADAIKVAPGETCLDESRLERRIARWLERDAIDERIGIRVSGGPGPTDVRFVLSRRGETPAERILDAVPEPCDQLHAAVALSIALSIDATLLGQGDVSNDEALGPEDELLDEPPGDDGTLLPRPTDRDLLFSPQLSVLLAAGIASGLVPGEAPVGRLLLGFSPFRWIDIRIGAVAAIAADRGFEFVPGRYQAVLYAGRLDVCLVTRVAGAMRLAGCLGTAVGGFGTQGDDSFPGGGSSQRSVWSAALAGLSVEIGVIGPVGVGLDLDLNAPLQARRIEVNTDDGRTLGFEELPPLAFAATLGPVLRFD